MDKFTKALTLLLTFSLLFLGGCATGKPVDFMDHLRPRYGFYQITLYSWAVGNGEYRFALIPEEFQETFLATFKRSDRYISSVGQLEAQLVKLPNNSFVAWRDNQEKNLMYPPNKTVNAIRTFAAKNKIKLETFPTLYE